MNKKTIQNIKYKAERKADKLKIKVEHFAAKNPVKTVAGGLLLGFIAGKVLKEK